jgi:hypothetical protein
MRAALFFCAAAFHDGSSTELWEDLTDDEPLEIFYAEHLLATWTIDASPWPTYHAGLVFKRLPPKNPDMIGVDFTPIHYERTMNTLRPEWVDGRIPTFSQYIVGDLGSLQWKNEAKVVAKRDPDQFENFTLIGNANGSHLRRYVAWAQEFVVDHPTFNPLGVYMSNEIKVYSRMCFDFARDSMFHLHDMGADFLESEDGQAIIARDYLYVFASRLQRNLTLDTAIERRRLLRFFRAWMLEEKALAQSFVFARPFLQLMTALQLSPYFYYDNQYARMQTHAPYVNYCFASFPLPPEVADIFAEGNYICARPMDPPEPLVTSDPKVLYGERPEDTFLRIEIGVEERLDVTEVYVFLIVAACASTASALRSAVA